MDLTLPIEGASGGAASLILYGLVQAARNKINGKKNDGKHLPCAEHGERMAKMEGAITALTSLVERLATIQTAEALVTHAASSTAICVVNEQGERIAALEAFRTTMSDGVLRIDLKLDTILRVLPKGG